MAVLKGLRHPSLVSLVGVSGNLNIIVLELANHGSLDTLLGSKSYISKQIQHSIALQVWYGNWYYVVVYAIIIYYSICNSIIQSISHSTFEAETNILFTHACYGNLEESIIKNKIHNNKYIIIDKMSFTQT